MNRRRLLRAAGVGLVGVAGCSERRESTTTTQRTATTPGLPYRGDGTETLPEPRGVVVHNQGDASRYVTVAVYDADQPILSRTFEVSASARVGVPEAIGASGTFRVVVETADGDRGTFDWRVAADGGDLEVVVAGEIAFWQTQRCAPGCPALGDGSSGPLPYKAGTGREPAMLVVENGADAPRSVRISIGSLHGTVLDYGYEVPARTRLRVPATSAPGVYAVVVRAGDERREYDWHVPEVEQLYVRVGDALGVDCGDASGSLRLVNRDDRQHELTVRVRDGDGVVFDRTVELPAGGERTIADAVSGSGRHTIEAATAEGASATGDWWLCPPVAQRLVQVHKWGGVVVGETGLS